MIGRGAGVACRCETGGTNHFASRHEPPFLVRFGGNGDSSRSSTPRVCCPSCWLSRCSHDSRDSARNAHHPNRVELMLSSPSSSAARREAGVCDSRVPNTTPHSVVGKPATRPAHAPVITPKGGRPGAPSSCSGVTSAHFLPLRPINGLSALFSDRRESSVREVVEETPTLCSCRVTIIVSHRQASSSFARVSFRSTAVRFHSFVPVSLLAPSPAIARRSSPFRVSSLLVSA
jgi:hypothetical protein